MFSNIPDKWKILNFTECIEKATASNKLKIPKKDYLEHGKYPIIDQSTDFVAGYTNNTEKIYNSELPVIIFGDHTRVFKYIDFPFSLGADGTKIIIPKKEIFNVKYLYYFLKSLKIEDHGYDRHYKYLKNKRVVSPPLKTQKKIVEILEKAEKLKEWRAETDQLADEYFKSVFLKMFGDPVKNEKNWNKSQLSELGTWKSGGTPSRQIKEFFTGNIPWYTSGELNNIYISESVENITEDAIENSNAKLIKPNSLLLGMYDTAALKSSITTINSSCNQAIAYSELEKNNSNIIFVYFAIQIGRKYFMSRQRGIRQKNLNLTMIKDTEIPLPPLKLQNQFADITKQFEEIKAYQSQSKQEINNLFNTLMQKAFKGELVC